MDSPSTKPERTSRKRLTDRRAQRNRRERVKAYITNLEQTVQELTEAAGDNSNSAMLKRLEEKRAEIADLTELLKQIHTLTADVLGVSSSAPFPDLEVSHLDKNKSSAQKPSSTGLRTHLKDRGPETSLAASPDDQSNVGAPDSDLAVCSPVAMSRDLTPDRLLSCHSGFENYFAVVNDSLQTLLASSEMSSVGNADDIIIRAILDGWNSFGEMKDLDRGWQLLRALDNGLFYRTGAVERLAILRVMRSTLVWRTTPLCEQHPPVPSFMCPTLTQIMVDHPPIVDFFVWPNMRDHLIVSMISYVPEAAAAIYASQIKLKWPFELRDAYKYRAADGIYEFSSEFDRVYQDIESWGLGSDPTLNMLVTTGPGGDLDSIDNSLDNALETEILLYSE
ncbi:hypothetical protein BJX65DRAFT_311731 [Aspergillus insuetus]